MNAYRCHKCKKLLLEAEFTGTILKVCERCKNLNTFTETSEQPLAIQSFKNHSKDEANRSHNISIHKR